MKFKNKFSYTAVDHLILEGLIESSSDEQSYSGYLKRDKTNSTSLNNMNSAQTLNTSNASSYTYIRLRRTKTEEKEDHILKQNIENRFANALRVLSQNNYPAHAQWWELHFNCYYLQCFRRTEKIDSSPYVASLLLEALIDNPEFILNAQLFITANNEFKDDIAVSYNQMMAIIDSAFTVYYQSIKACQYDPENAQLYVRALLMIQHQFNLICKQVNISLVVKNYFTESLSQVCEKLDVTWLEEDSGIDLIFSGALNNIKIKLDLYDTPGNRELHNGFRDLITVYETNIQKYPNQTTSEKMITFDAIKKLVVAKDPDNFFKSLARMGLNDAAKNYKNINNRLPDDYTPGLTNTILKTCQQIINDCDAAMERLVDELKQKKYPEQYSSGSSCTIQ